MRSCDAGDVTSAFMRPMRSRAGQARGCRPRSEWELAAQGLAVQGNFIESGQLWPVRGPAHAAGPQQMFGDVWEWTRSAYLAYPGFRPSPGALGEYNGKFMWGQLVLRGGSCATPRRTSARSYRNFFPPQARWQFTGIRLANGN